MSEYHFRGNKVPKVTNSQSSNKYDQQNRTLYRQQKHSEDKGIQECLESKSFSNNNTFKIS